MTTGSTREKVRGFVTENFLLGAESTELEDDVSFLSTGIVDSTGVMELVAFLEDEFGITVEDTELVPENLDSVDQLCRYLEGKGVAAGAPGSPTREVSRVGS